jgi:hypothetical protein
MSLSDTQTMRILRSPDGADVTTNNEMAQGLEVMATQFKVLASNLREGKMFVCPSCGGAAFCGTDKDGDVTVDMELHFKLTIPNKPVVPN